MKKKLKRWALYGSALRKPFLIMRWSFFIFIISIFQAQATPGFAQKTAFSLSYTNASVAKVLSKIEDESNFYFMCNRKLVDLDRVITIQVENQSLEKVLTEIFTGTDVEYVITGKQIVLAPRKNDFQSDETTQQSFKVSGRVTDSSGAALPGVTVLVKGTTQGVITDTSGNYSLTNVPSGGTLVFSFVGMKTQEMKVAGKTKIDITLVEETIGIEEVVAIGYGTKSKATVTGAISTVDEKQLESRPTSNTTDLLQGTVAGVQITRGNSGRIAYSSNNISIRGLTSRSDPGVLIVIDGIAQKENGTYAIDNINPDDIKDISILKDAQASIYGARAAGGVILITTKKGTTEKPTIEFSANYNIQSPSLWTKLNDVIQVCEMNNEGFVNDGQNTNMYSHIIKYIADNNLTRSKISNNTGEYFVTWPFDNSANIVFGYYDWSDIMFDPALMQTYNLSISGKTKKFNYYNSVSYIDQDGMMSYGSNYNKRISCKFKNDFKVTDFLEVNTNFSFQNQKIIEPNNYDGMQSWQGLLWPCLMPYNKYGHLYNFGSNQNPIGFASESGDMTTLNYRISGLLGLVFTPFKDFKVTSEISSNFDISENDWANLGFDMYDENDKYSYNSTNNRNSAGANYRRSRYTVANLYANYEYILLDKHRFNFLAGYSHEEDDTRAFSAERRLGLISSEVPTFAMGDPAQQYNGESKADMSLNSAYSRVGYDFEHKYLIEGNFRYDGSSKFAKGYKWAPFFGVSGAWVLSNEKFMQKMKNAIDYLKIRSSWGQMGNQASIGLYDFISQVNIGGRYPMGNPLSPVISQSATLGGMSSLTRSWETIETSNIGIDYGGIDSRLSLTLDFFVKNNKNMFFSKEFPQVLGTSAPSINGAHVRTKGWEISIGWKDKVGEFSYFANLNLSNNTNKVVELAEAGIPSLGTNGYLQGYPVGSIFGYKFDGFIQNESELSAYTSKFTSGIPNNLKPGDVRYVDMDGDGKLIPQAYQLGQDGKPTATSGDLVKLGDSGQHYLFGINLGGSWKNIDFRAFFQGVGKWTVYETNDPSVYPFMSYYYGKEWTTATPNSIYPRLTQDGTVLGYDFRISDAPFKLYNNRYIRLKNLQIGYTLPSSISQKVKLDKVRVYFSGTDLWEANKLPGTYDPEKPFALQATPMPRGYSFGINITL